MIPALIIFLSLLAAPSLQAKRTFSQSLQLHEGWNLVSWHIDPEDLDPTDPLEMQEFIPDESMPPPYQYAAWFHENGGKLYTYEDARYNYNYPDLPESYQWVWDLNWAYYIWLDISYPWQCSDRPQFDRDPFPIEPDPAWDDSLDIFYPDQVTNGWFFMGYSAPAYCKLATIYNNWPPPNGSEQYRDYRGPFHWLYWDENDPENDHYAQNQQYLIMVMSDEGRIYLPYDPNNPYYPQIHDQEYDEIGVLEPGRGYFLGFRQESTPMSFEGWGDFPGWPESAPADPKEAQHQIASANHFQFKEFTHWMYPVFIDTVDLSLCPMEAGDEIAVFDGELCVGASVHQGEFPLKITCWKDDMATLNVLDGYIAGSDMTFVWYDASENQEITLELPPQTQAMADDPIAPAHSGFGAGVYAFRSLIYGVNSVQQLPQEFRLGQNYPNPFNAETMIPLELPQRSQVKIELFNVRGQNLGVIYEGIQNAGWPKVRYNARRLSSGVYFYCITAEGLERGGRFTDAGKMLVLK